MFGKSSSESILILKEKLLELRRNLNKIEKKQVKLFDRQETSAFCSDSKKRAVSVEPSNRRTKDKEYFVSPSREKLALQLANEELKKEKEAIQEQYELLLKSYNKQERRIEELLRENQRLKKDIRINSSCLRTPSSTPHPAPNRVTFSKDLTQVSYVNKSYNPSSKEHSRILTTESHDESSTGHNDSKSKRKSFMYSPLYHSLDEKLKKLKNIIKHTNY